MAWLWSLTPATTANFPAKHPNSKTPWSCQLHGAVVQMEVEFWSTSFAALTPPRAGSTELRLQLELAPPGVLEWSSSTQSWSHAKHPLSRNFLQPASRSSPHLFTEARLHHHHLNMPNTTGNPRRHVFLTKDLRFKSWILTLGHRGF